MANKRKKKVKGRDAAGMSLKKTMKSSPSDGGRPSVMAQKKGGQGKRMTRTITTRTAPRSSDRGAAMAASRAAERAAVRGATIGATEGMSRIPFRNSFIERIRSRQQD